MQYKLRATSTRQKKEQKKWKKKHRIYLNERKHSLIAPCASRRSLFSFGGFAFDSVAGREWLPGARAATITERGGEESFDREPHFEYN